MWLLFFNYDEKDSTKNGERRKHVTVRTGQAF
jgi:hypothetical protein